MNVTISNESAESVVADAVVVGHYEGSALSAATEAIDRATNGSVTQLIEAGEITGKHAETTLLLAPAGVKSLRLVILGLGKAAEMDRGRAFRATAAAAKALAKKSMARVAFCVADGWSDDVTEAAIAGVIAGCQGQDLYRSERKLHSFGELLWTSATAAAVQGGWILGEATNLTRRLVNEPPAEIYPESFAAAAEKVAAECRMEIEVWVEERLVKERCGSLLAVARGSSRPPRLVMMHHRGGDDDAPTLALVGKGVTFDSGGLSLKDTENMKTMKCDMAGAATVLGAMQAISRLKLRVNVVGLVGLVENMVSGNSYKLGDVLTARNGKTIEVLNTDAEGRLVLADVLDVAVGLGVTGIIDLATLTGACVVALGRDVAGAMSNNQEWCDRVLHAARVCGEQAWPLPMFPEYSEHIRSNVADIKNVGDGRWGGAISAAKFLEEFVAGKPWVHLDIAGPAFFDSPKPWLDAGGSGLFVRTLVEVARGWDVKD